MLVSEIKGSWRHHLIAQSPLWNRSIESLQPLDLSVFLRRHWGTDQQHEATRQVEDLIDKGYHAMIDRDIQTLPAITYFEPTPPQRITVGELTSWLSETSLARRRAVLFGLETGILIQDIIGLTWKKLNAMQGVPEYARSLANAQARHFKLDYVFWEPMPNLAAAPLFGLGETFQEVSQGLGYDTLRRLYAGAIPVHAGADCEAFQLDLCTEYSKRIGN